MSFLEQLRPQTPPPGHPNATPRPGGGPIIEAELDTVRRATEGTRNATLNQAAFNLAQLFDERLWHAELLQAATGAGLALREAENTIRSAVRGAARNPRPPHRIPNNGNTPHNGVYPTLPGAEPAAPGPSPYLDWEQAYTDQKDIEWLCEPFIPTGRLVALYSPPKVGKSLLALEIATAISRGTDMFGTPTTQTTVLYLDYENAVQDVVARLKDMGRAAADMTNLKYCSFPMNPPLDTPAGGHAVLDAAQHTGAKLVIIDTISRCISGEENDATTWLNLYRHTLLPLKSAGIAVLRLDHTGKDEHKGQRGSSAKSGDVDLTWKLNEMIRGTQYVLECESHRIQMHETLLNLERTSAPLGHRVDTRTISDTKTRAIFDACQRAGLPLSAGRDQIRKVMDGAGLKASNGFLAELTRRRQGQVDTP